MHHMKALTILFSTLFTAPIYAAENDRPESVSVSYGKNMVAICEDSGKPIWEYNTEGHDGHDDVQLLLNGNILFHDTWTHMLEVSLDKKIVWEYPIGAGYLYQTGLDDRHTGTRVG